jgi:membrane-bound metal-dependent hydrolase YbcI (DUF457 family)
MWFLGHLAIGYFIGISISKFTQEKINLPLLFFFSILPDIDVFIPELQHRSVTHSVVLALTMFIPIFLISKSGFAYFCALASHTLIGDFFTGSQFQLFWPVTNEFFLSPDVFRLTGLTENFIEYSFFAIMAYINIQKVRKRCLRETSENTKSLPQT